MCISEYITVGIGKCLLLIMTLIDEHDRGEAQHRQHADASMPYTKSML